ncbi:MAG TPA: DUF1499 domain-containing protein [bacterium]|nr:DUF1499 domain-containing protein [bacterium]
MPKTGIHEGRLAPCPSAPHCVSTQSEDPRHRLEPFRYVGSKDVMKKGLVQAIQSMPGAAVIEIQDDYLHAEFRSRIMKFVDDLEVYFEPGQKIIHFRSCSRKGYFDFGVNRKRVESLKNQLSGLQQADHKR